MMAVQLLCVFLVRVEIKAIYTAFNQYNRYDREERGNSCGIIGHPGKICITYNIAENR